MRRTVVSVTGAAVAALICCAPASADTTITVRGTDFPSGIEAQLSFVGCENPFLRTTEPLAPTIGYGPGTAPAGQRSLGWDLAGGNAIGSLHYVASMAGTTVAALSVHAEARADGVAFAGYVDPADTGTGVMWVGRSALSAAPGAWRTIDAPGLTYTWARWDNTTQQVLETADPATVSEFMAAHGGDGPGFYTIGFGCDGTPFHMDALRIGSPGDVTTYDLEGLTTSTTMGAASARSIVAGQQVTLTGALRDGSAGRLPEATVILEARQFGDGDFRTVEVVPADTTDPTYVVEPTTRTTYRWRFAGRPLAEASTSRPVTIDVASALTAAQQFDPGNDTVRVVGQATPARPGAPVTLWKVTSKGPEKIDVRKVAGDGGYVFEFVADGSTAGRYVVTIPSGAGNLAGLSQVVHVRPADIRR
ncbi:hypothetical protein [Nocardioides sp.]|uniref:hypothetical protein n=1 Tax=Nocardioides sp. TaxID=35761 RepID=UPI0031FEE327|nr:hypothetical protein [Nocardioides sp.]